MHSITGLQNTVFKNANKVLVNLTPQTQIAKMSHIPQVFKFKPCSSFTKYEMFPSHVCLQVF